MTRPLYTESPLLPNEVLRLADYPPPQLLFCVCMCWMGPGDFASNCLGLCLPQELFWIPNYAWSSRSRRGWGGHRRSNNCAHRLPAKLIILLFQPKATAIPPGKRIRCPAFRETCWITVEYREECMIYSSKIEAMLKYLTFINILFIFYHRM